jgi:SagB-type dehydrogenase family enzyme
VLRDIEEFYNKTKVNKAHILKGKMPIEYVHIFHKEYQRFPAIKLKEASGNSEYDRLLQSRKSDRVFSNRSVSLDVLAKIIGSCRITSRDKSGVTPFERRTYPSAGARFPIELYLVAFRISGLEQGVYHLNFNKFSLEVLLKANMRKYEKEIVSSFLRNTAGAIIMTTAMSRSEVKYGIRAYPFSLIEAGHMGQNITLSCTELGVGSCAIGGFVNDRITELLDLTNDELPIYVIAFGWPKAQVTADLR